MVPVASSEHVLGCVQGEIPEEAFAREVQVVLTEKSRREDGEDRGVLSQRTWRVADLGTKLEFLRAGMGWGNMPWHLVREDVIHGRLKVLLSSFWPLSNTRIPMVLLTRRDYSPGPAGRWLLAELVSMSREMLEKQEKEVRHEIEQLAKGEQL